jgi:uncharacterized protein (TIGR02246 family)
MTSTDDTQLRDLFARACQAWTDGDAHAYGQCFTEDSDYVSYDGARAIGRAPMVESHDRLFRGVLSGSRLVGDVESIRYVRPDIAVLHATGSVLTPWQTKLPKRRLSRQTIVAVKDGGEWRFSALHNGRVRPVTIPAPDSFPARAAKLLGRLSRAVGAGRARDALA